MWLSYLWSNVFFWEGIAGKLRMSLLPSSEKQRKPEGSLDEGGEGGEGGEEPCRGKQSLSCWLRHWLNFKWLRHYQVSYKMKNFRLLYQQTTPVTLFPICFCLFVFVVVVFFCREKTLRKLWENSCGREGTQSKRAQTTYPDSRTAHTVTNDVESGFLYLRVIE